MSVNGIEAIGPLSGIGGTAGVDGINGVDLTIDNTVEGPTGPSADFGRMLTDSITALEGMNDRTDNLAIQAATGDLNAIHDYTIAATELSVATQLAVSVRNKAVEAFTEIMRMPV